MVDDGHPLDPVEEVRAQALGRARELEPLEVGKRLLQEDPQLEAGEVRSQAEVRAAEPERHVLVRLPADVEAERIRELRLVAIGLALGVPAAIAGTGLVQSMLYGLDRTDPTTMAAAAVVMTAVALVAAFVPARRASNVDPIVALRLE